MQIGLFGKLPVKRDFVSINLPRGFLTVWENWLQSSVAASRVSLGHEWQELFLTAPIWRFWLGRDLGGTTVTGAFMPSVDGVGRYFPLTICAWGEDSEVCDPPACDDEQDWFDTVESALLEALSPEFDGEPARLLDKVAAPSPRAGSVLRDLFVRDLETVLGSRSYWWSKGGAGRPMQLVAYERMPDPYRFGGFITGRFEPADGA